MVTLSTYYIEILRLASNSGIKKKIDSKSGYVSTLSLGLRKTLKVIERVSALLATRRNKGTYLCIVTGI